MKLRPSFCHTAQAPRDPITIGAAIFAAVDATAVGGTVIGFGVTLSTVVGYVAVGERIMGALFE